MPFFCFEIFLTFLQACVGYHRLCLQKLLEAFQKESALACPNLFNLNSKMYWLQLKMH